MTKKTPEAAGAVSGRGRASGGAVRLSSADLPQDRNHGRRGILRLGDLAGLGGRIGLDGDVQTPGVDPNVDFVLVHDPFSFLC